MNKVLYNDGTITVEEIDGVRGLYYKGKCQGKSDSWYFKNIVNMVWWLDDPKYGMSDLDAIVFGGGPCLLSSELLLMGFKKVTTVDKNGLMFDLAKKYFNYLGKDNITAVVHEQNLDMFGKANLVINDMWDGFKKQGPPDEYIFNKCVTPGGILISNHGTYCTFMAEPQKC